MSAANVATETADTARACKLCKRELPASAPGRLVGKQWTCRHCLSMETLLYRHLGPADQQGWSAAGRDDFFRKSARLETGNYRWETVRTMVIECQTVERVREEGNKVKAKALPMDVWLAKGYAREAVLQFPSGDCPILGPLYAVPVKETTLKEIKRAVEQEVQRKEQAAKSKGKRKQEGEEDDQWDVVPEQAKGSSKGAAKAPKVSGRCEEKNAKSLEKEREKQEKRNTEMSAFAARAAAALSKNLKQLESVLAQCNKANIDSEDVEAAKQAHARAATWNKAAGEMLGVATATKGTGAKLPELKFGNKDLSEYCKATVEVLKSLRAALKESKEAKTKAVEEKKAQQAAEENK